MALALSCAIVLPSCLGSFALTERVKAWNRHVGNKFVNEVVYLAFWGLGVYPICYISDLTVINAIEFWSGKNPMATADDRSSKDSLDIKEIPKDSLDINDGATGTQEDKENSKPLQDQSVVIDKNHDVWHIVRDNNGYTLTRTADNTTLRFDFDRHDRSWSVTAQGKRIKFMRFIDDDMVEMATPDGKFRQVELSSEGVMAFRADVLRSVCTAAR